MDKRGCGTLWHGICKCIVERDIHDIMAMTTHILLLEDDINLCTVLADYLHSKGYNLGCDDYVTKPYSMDILICKIEAVLRRYRIHEKNNEMEFDLNGLRFDAVRQLLGEIRLSSRENELLLTLCQNMGKVVDRSRILTSLWGEDTYFNSRSLSVYINHLRNYIGKDSSVKILSVHGKGYKMVIMNEQSNKSEE